jgi:hypothetical protein
MEITPADGISAGLPRVKLYGERNCGTHYLTRLMAANLDASLLESVEPRYVRRTARYLRRAEVVRDLYYHFAFTRTLGWKHMNPRSAAELRARGIDVDALRFVFLIKNPYSWVVSMIRNPYHLGVTKPVDIDQFVRRRWRCTRRENMGTRSATLMQVWTTKIRSYFSLVDQATGSIVRYEDLLVDPAASMAALASALTLPRRSDIFVNVDMSAKRAGREQGRTFDSYRRYYVNQEWRRKLTDTAIEAINADLEPGLMSRLGYEIIGVSASAASGR